MSTKVDIAGTYVFQGQRLTHPSQPFYLRFEVNDAHLYEPGHGNLFGKPITGLSYTTPTGFLRCMRSARTFLHAYRLDGKLICRSPDFIYVFPETNSCRLYWRPAPEGYDSSYSYEITPTNDDTGRLILTIQPCELGKMYLHVSHYPRRAHYVLYEHDDPCTPARPGSYHHQWSY